MSKASERRDAQRANSRGFLNPWKQKERIKMASVKTRNGNVAEGLKAPRYLNPHLSDGLNCEGFMPSTGLKTRGYLTSRLPDD